MKPPKVRKLSGPAKARVQTRAALELERRVSRVVNAQVAMEIRKHVVGVMVEIGELVRAKKCTAKEGGAAAAVAIVNPHLVLGRTVADAAAMLVDRLELVAQGKASSVDPLLDRVLGRRRRRRRRSAS